MPTPITSDAEMGALLARAGFQLTPEQIAEYAEAYGYIVEMSARIRGERSYMVEPAHVFSFPTEEIAR
ncbi:MAG: hypothetical protein DCF30_19870 [Hyphomicrobiales bacterium]|nr:MAG: hypothetical protein DCF30_19870 [Hyphomicrobiales bacterium]